MNIIYVFLLFLPNILNHFEKYKSIFSAQYNKDNIEYTNKNHLNKLNEGIYEYNALANLNLLEILDINKYIGCSIIGKNVNSFKNYIKINDLMNTFNWTVSSISSKRVSRQLSKMQENDVILGSNKHKEKIHGSNDIDFSVRGQNLAKDKNFSNSEHLEGRFEDIENDMKEDSEYYDNYEHYIEEEEYDDEKSNKSFKNDRNNIPLNRIIKMQEQDNNKSNDLDSFLEKGAYNDIHASNYEDNYDEDEDEDDHNEFSFLEKGNFDNEYDEDNYNDDDEDYKKDIISFLEKKSFDDDYYEDNDEYEEEYNQDEFSFLEKENFDNEYDEDYYKDHIERDRDYEEDFLDEDNKNEYAYYEYGNNAFSNDDLHSKKKIAPDYDQNSFIASHLPHSKEKSNLSDDLFDNHHLNQINKSENVYSFIQNDIENVINIMNEHANAKDSKNHGKISVRKLMNKKNEPLDLNKIKFFSKISNPLNKNESVDEDSEENKNQINLKDIKDDIFEKEDDENEKVFEDWEIDQDKVDEEKVDKNITDEETFDENIVDDKADDNVDDKDEDKFDETSKIPEITETMEKYDDSTEASEISKMIEPIKTLKITKNLLDSKNSQDLKNYPEFSDEHQRTLEISEKLSRPFIEKAIDNADIDDKQYATNVNEDNDHIFKNIHNEDNLDDKLTDQGVVENTLLSDNEYDINDDDDENNNLKNAHEQILGQSSNNLVKYNSKYIHSTKKMHNILPHNQSHHKKNEKSNNENEQILDVDNEESSNMPVAIETEENDITHDKGDNNIKSTSSVSVLSYLLIFFLPIYIQFIIAQ